MDTGDGLAIDQDTSIKKGFLSKLSKGVDEEGLKKSAAPGILSPDEAGRSFSEQGEAMFSSSAAEDRELLDSMMGSSKNVGAIVRDRDETPTRKVREAPVEIPVDDVEAARLRSLIASIGREGGREGGSSDPDDIFGSNMGLPLPVQDARQRQQQAEAEAEAAAAAAVAKATETRATMPTTSTKTPEVAATAKAGAGVMSPAEAADLQARLDRY